MAFNPKDSRNLVIALGLGAAAGAAVMPIVIMVEAYTAYEAAARGLDEIIRQGGRITVIQVVEQVPGREFMIKPEQILKWVSSSGANDNVGLRQVKQRMRDKLKPTD